MTLVSNLENRIQVQTNLDVSYYDNDKIAFVCTTPLKTLVANCCTRKAKRHKKKKTTEDTTDDKTSSFKRVIYMNTKQKHGFLRVI